MIKSAFKKLNQSDPIKFIFIFYSMKIEYVFQLFKTDLLKFAYLDRSNVTLFIILSYFIYSIVPNDTSISRSLTKGTFYHLNC